LESILGEAEVTALETTVPVRNGCIKRSDRRIALKFLEEYADTVFLVVDVESLLGEAEVSAL